MLDLGGTIKAIAIYFGLPVFFILLGMFLFTQYPKIKTIISDILRFFGFLGKWVRKKSVETEIEGTINSFSKHFVSDTSIPLLPECAVQWVTEKNLESVMQEGKAIIRLSFSTDNHDLNYFNAAYAFMQTALLNKTKPFIKKTTNRAIDLLMTKILLARSNRSALHTFNNNFIEEAQECKDVFFKVEETEETGLFRKILLPEYYFFGESLGEKTPKQQYEDEAENFLEWFYQLATREHGERSNLRFVSDNFKIGVILVASQETHGRYGIDAYLRRANLYAADDFNCIYICSRGLMRGSLVKEIANNLTATGCFESLTKKPDSVKFNSNGQRFIVTCIALKPSLTTIVQKAWEKLQDCFQNAKLVPVTIQSVYIDNVIVDAYGLRIELPLERLSSIKITDARRYFEIDQELSVKILEIQPEDNKIVLSNAETDTDPRKIIEQFKLATNANEIVESTVQKIIVKDDFEIGIITKIKDTDIEGYIPRSRATYSNFVSLSFKYPVGSTVAVKLLNFNAEYARFTCAISNLLDPWENIAIYSEGQRLKAAVCQISERYLLCELSEGIEGKVNAAEMSWDSLETNLGKIKNTKIGDTIEAKILKINPFARIIYLSIKQLTMNPAEQYYIENKDSEIEITIDEVLSTGARIIFPSLPFRGYLPISELSFFYCPDISKYLKPGEKVKVKLIEYKPLYNNIIVSIKQLISKNYDLFKSFHKEGDIVDGFVKAVQGDRATVIISASDGSMIESYVHKAETSNILYVDNNLFNKLITLNESYKFIIKRFDDSHKIIELSRKRYFEKNIMSLKYGEKYNVKILKHREKEYYVFSNDLESILIDPKKEVRVHSGTLNVILTRIDAENNKAEVALIDR
jgi:ribosomal protein S1